MSSLATLARRATALAALFVPAAALAQGAISESIVHSFSAPETGYVWAGVVQGADGNLYGTSEFTTSPYGGFGTVFQVTPAGVLTTLHAFDITDGAYPLAGLVAGSDGNFYGTTADGGNVGSVFRVAPDGTFMNVHTFLNYYVEGSVPYAGLIQGIDGNFYGTTTGSGAHGRGTVFQMSPTGAVNPLYSFSGGDGANPQAALVQGSDGNFYGTTVQGGAKGLGTVFMLTPQGTLSVLHSFGNTDISGNPDGAGPTGALVEGSDKNFYGTTSGGGGTGVGTIFQITPQGVLTTLYTFPGTTLAFPGVFWPCSVSGLIQGRDGNLYGTTAAGGTTYGSVFKITYGGALTTVYSFGGAPDGVTPCSGVFQGKDGNLYGTTWAGGANNLGTVYKITLPNPSAPPVITTSSLPAGQAYSASAAGTQYLAQLSATGVPPLSWSASGLPPGLSVSASGSNWVISGSISSDVPDTYNVTLSLTDSSGYAGPPTQKTLALMTTCGAPGSVPAVPSLACGIALSNAQWPASGDTRDVLIYEHVARGVFFHPGQTPPSGTSVVAPANDRGPHCDDFARAGPFSHFFPSYAAVTSKADTSAGLAAYASCFDWTVLSQTLTSPAQPGPLYGVGLDAWIDALLDMGDASAASRQIKTSYRDPDASAALYGTVQSAHQFGGAIDLSLFSSCTTRCTWHQLREWDEEWDKVVSAARWANFPRIQGNTQQVRVGEANFPGPCYPGNQSCVHADLGHGPHTPNVNP